MASSISVGSSTRIGPGKPVFQRASGSTYRVSQEPHFDDVGSRPVDGPSAFIYPKPVNLRQRKYGQPVKDQGGDVHGAHLRPAL